MINQKYDNVKIVECLSNQPLTYSIYEYAYDDDEHCHAWKCIAQVRYWRDVVYYFKGFAPWLDVDRIAHQIK